MCQVESEKKILKNKTKRLSYFNCTLSGTRNGSSLPSRCLMGRKWNMFNVLWALAVAKERIKDSATFVCVCQIRLTKTSLKKTSEMAWRQCNQNSDRRSTKNQQTSDAYARKWMKVKLNFKRFKESLVDCMERVGWSWFGSFIATCRTAAYSREVILEFPNHTTFSVYGKLIKHQFRSHSKLKMGWCWRNETSN